MVLNNMTIVLLISELKKGFINLNESLETFEFERLLWMSLYEEIQKGDS